MCKPIDNYNYVAENNSIIRIVQKEKIDKIR